MSYSVGSFSIVLIRFFIFLFALPVSAQESDGMCSISLQGLSHERAKPGEVISLYGKWGNSRGEKIPVINRGGSNKLEVLSWSPQVIKARIPDHLLGGDYKVGVYCRDLSKGRSGSSGFKTLIIGAPLTIPPTPLPEKRVKRAPTKKARKQTSKKEEMNIPQLLEEYWWVLLVLFMLPMIFKKRD